MRQFLLRIADELRGLRNRIRVMFPGDEPGTFRVFLCADVEEATAYLHR